MNPYLWKKNILDRFFAFILLVFFFPFLLVIFIVISIDTQSSGIFVQKRVGQYGKLFNIYKLKSVHPTSRRISAVGKFIRKTKMDELTQLWNVLKGDMSFVGFRPDIPGYYDKLIGDERKILQLKPGLTSEASLKYRNEEQLLQDQENPLHYNDNIIFPDKVKMNLEYTENVSFGKDLDILLKTLSVFLIRKKRK